MASKNSYKNIFSDIHVSKGLERNVMNMTENKKTKAKSVFKLAYVCSIVLCVFVFSLSVVYAKEIKESIEKWAVSMFMGDGTKIQISENNITIKLPDNVSKEEKDEMTLEEVEKMLDLDLLSSSMFTISTNNINYIPTIINKNIERVNLWYPYCVTYSEEKNISAMITLLTDKATSHVSLSDQGIDASGGKVLAYTYKSKNLNVDVVIYGVDWSGSRLTATFVYKNISYTFVGREVSKQEMLDLIETLK